MCVCVCVIKMDVEAVRHATDDVLEDLGLTKTGDRVSLRAFCQTSKKRSLLEVFLSRKKKKMTKFKEG